MTYYHPFSSSFDTLSCLINPDPKVALSGDGQDVINRGPFTKGLSVDHAYEKQLLYQCLLSRIDVSGKALTCQEMNSVFFNRGKNKLQTALSSL